MLSGSILDVYPDYQQNAMAVWLVNNQKATRITVPYEPCFYVHAPSQDLSKLASALEALPQVKSVQCTAEKLTLGSPTHTMVLQVTPAALGVFHKLARLVDSWGGHHAYQLFNVDLRFPSRFLQEHGVFCHAHATWDGNHLTTNDEQWAIDYDIPLLKTMHLDIRQNKKGAPSFQEPINQILLDQTIIEEDNETDTILTALRTLREQDPDVITTDNGDSIIIPFLYHRAKLCGIEHLVNLDREKQQNKNNLQPVKEAKSYFSYGRIVYRPAFYTLQGRLHLDTAQSFFYGESGFRGILDIARCANIPLQLLSRLGPGTAISQMEENTAIARGYLVPWKKTLPENWKTAEELLIADRGGLVLEPVVGLHENILELDYASLYPNIMVCHNISPETLLCACCPDSAHHVPQLGYHICTRQKGLLPEVLEPILLRRFCYKARAKNQRYDQDTYLELQKAWKWVLVVCFGYTGYRNARYGRIECHESITAYSRDILLSAVEAAQQAGYEVLHGIIDSLWVKPTTRSVSPSRLTRLISTRTGVRMDVEGRYKWIVFLPSKATGVGALTRYYGMFDTGKIKARGVELRQHNTPAFLKQMQQDMLAVFSEAGTAEEFLALIPNSLDVMHRTAECIKNNTIPGEYLVFTTRVSRDLTGYKVHTLTKSALLQLQDLRVQVEPGQSVRYLVTDEQTRNYKRRVCVAEAMTGKEDADVDFYLRQIAKCAESILTPFGYTIEKLQDHLKKR